MSNVTCTYVKGVALLTLCNAQKLNALTAEMLRALEHHISEIEMDNTTRAIILTGEGHKAFCCGADIAEWGPLGPAEFARYWVRNGHRVFDRLARCCKPTIAAINGHAFGGGLELASCCDLRVIAPCATLALPEARVGIVPGWSGTQRLTRLLPEAVVKEMALFGRRISADRAVTTGFATEIAEHTLATAQDIAATLDDISPRANEVAKAMIHAAVGEDRAAAIETLGSAAGAASADRDEGVQAFLEKRSPKFNGH